MCFGGSPSIPTPPPVKETAAPVQAAVAPAVGNNQGDPTINANRRGKTSLRINLDPIASAGNQAGTGLST